jgi:transposase InsO family protein
MVSRFFPLQYVIAAIAIWLNRQQQEVIDYLKEENRLLKKKLAGGKIHFTDVERRRLATRAKALGRKGLSELDTLVTADTLLRWHRELVAQKWNYVQRRSPGRPRTKDEIAALILRMAEENPSWGYTRIRGALSNVGYQVARGTIASILREHGIDPAPLRGKRTKWSTFLKAHCKMLVASDFFTVEVWRLHGLTTYCFLFFLELSTRLVKISGITTNPNAAWMVQIGRNLMGPDEGWFSAKRKLIIDRDPKYCADFRALIERGGSEIIRLPPRSPNLNAHAERFVGSIKSECLNCLIFFGEASLRRAIRNYVIHYHQERNHQGVNNQLLTAAANDLSQSGNVVRRERLGGILNHYHRICA